ncbi:hypothetical protein Q7C36_003258 [Tachysurus vachellii]|uniref:Uncharacterized protein n=1 Tax=Tachysurus vachellii TaxID=175792 RepID=A0AA88T790_TACVA|nr:hypothetical protein Q7C36_003258 [Tachysurus vachellii]
MYNHEQSKLSVILTELENTPSSAVYLSSLLECSAHWCCALIKSPALCSVSLPETLHFLVFLTALKPLVLSLVIFTLFTRITDIYLLKHKDGGFEPC